MTSSLHLPLKRFYSTRQAPCPYVAGRVERKVFTELAGEGRDPEQVHEALTAAGFRRSHGIAYKPICQGCNACIPLRVSASRFQPTRSQRRIQNRNSDLIATETEARATTEQFELFSRYQGARHGDGGMALMDFSDYAAMVEETPIRTGIVEFRDPDERLYGVALTDYLRDGLSMVYSFFDPKAARLSLGTKMILWHIATARQRELDFVYLGYWIRESQKMAYKARFRPVEGLVGGDWVSLESNDGSSPDQSLGAGSGAV